MNNQSSFQQVCTVVSNTYTSTTNNRTWSTATETPPGTCYFVAPKSLTSNSNYLSPTIASETYSRTDCSNCGGNYHVNKCHQPKDPECIRQAQLKHCTKVQNKATQPTLFTNKWSKKPVWSPPKDGEIYCYITARGSSKTYTYAWNPSTKPWDLPGSIPSANFTSSSSLAAPSTIISHPVPNTNPSPDNSSVKNIHLAYLRSMTEANLVDL